MKWNEVSDDEGEPDVKRFGLAGEGTRRVVTGKGKGVGSRGPGPFPDKWSVAPALFFYSSAFTRFGVLPTKGPSG